jgi:FMN reductase [NAD(P)H]
MKNINTRRSIRKYSDKEVSEQLLNRLFAEASRTQTMGNMQLYSAVVTRSEEVKEQLSPAHFNQPMVKQAPVVITICADFRRSTDWCLQRNADPGYNNFLSFMNAATDALLFTQTFCNLAEEEGLGLCFLGTTVYMPQMIIDTLHLPKLVMPVATLTVGWPAEEPALTDRLSTAAFVHQETYHTATGCCSYPLHHQWHLPLYHEGDDGASYLRLRYSYARAYWQAHQPLRGCAQLC